MRSARCRCAHGMRPASRLRRRRASRCAFCVCALCLDVAAAQPQYPAATATSRSRGSPASELPPQLKDVTFEQRLNEHAAARRDVQGRARPHREARRLLRRSKPVVLAFVYYQCPMLCTQVMNGISQLAEGGAVHAGRGLRRRARQLRSARHAGGRRPRRSARTWRTGTRRTPPARWHFLTGDEATIRRVTSAAGFTYRWDEPTRPVRARQRRAGGHAGRPAVALLLRRRVLAEGAAAGAGRVGRGQDRLGRSTSCCSTATTTTRRPVATASS